MKTFIVVNVDTGALLYFDCPVNCIGADLPTIPQDLIGYEPSNLNILRLVVFKGMLTLREAKQRGMRYIGHKIVDSEGGEYEVEEL